MQMATGTYADAAYVSQRLRVKGSTRRSFLGLLSRAHGSVLLQRHMLTY